MMLSARSSGMSANGPVRGTSALRDRVLRILVLSAGVGISSFAIPFCGAVVRAQDAAVDTTPLPVHFAPKYTEFRPRRPVVITHAGDGTQRLFVVTQQGVVQIAPEKADAAEGHTFLDIEAKVDYTDQENEEGLLGMAFHPRFRENGEFFLYYISKDPAQTANVSRFRVFSNDPQRADPASEEVIMQIAQPYWNHNGGTLAFGPDGYLYIALGDGGKFNDPHMNGQNAQALLGKILRIDVNRRDKDLQYAIPAENPFYDKMPLARGEIYAYGFRNVWRMAFDRETGELWAADVGQDLWEEINLVRAGGNYGWNLREGQHKFGPVGSEPRADLIDPVFEYPHEVGKSITGGTVYRGKKLPALRGYYLYADYVSGKLWGLKIDPQTQKVVANRPILGENVPVITFGEDEAGEVYFSDPFGRIFEFQAN